MLYLAFPMFIGLINLLTEQKVDLMTVIVVLDEMFFVLYILLSGKEFLQKIKHFFKVNWWRLRLKLR